MTELTAPVGIGTDNPVATLDIGGGTAALAERYISKNQQTPRP
jgi:hypothetical protein